MKSISYRVGRQHALKGLGLIKQAEVKTELQPHQARVVSRIENSPGLVVAHGLGSGKTLTSIAAADQLGMPTTVLVPASLESNYKKEIAKHTSPSPSNMQVESLQRAVLRKEMPRHGLLIVDEAHRLRDPATKGRQVIRNSEADKTLLLTASPIYNHPADIAPLVNIVSNTNTLPENKAEFEAKYIDSRRINPGILARVFLGVRSGERTSLKNEKELKKILDQWVDYHANKKTDYPSRTEETVEVPMSEKQQELYDALMNKAPAWVRYKVKKGLPPSKTEKRLINAFLTTPRQVSGNVRPYVEGMSSEESAAHAAKSNEAFKRFMEQRKKNPAHKALIYSNYLDAGLEPYEELLKQHKVPYGKFTGKVPKKERDALIKAYNENKLPVLMVTSAGGEGLDLKGTRQIQLLEPHWNNEKLEQVIGRGIRYRSHADLPESDRNVHVERYIATTRPTWWNNLLKSKPKRQTADQYLHMLASDKDKLNTQLYDLLASQEKSTST